MTDDEEEIEGGQNELTQINDYKFLHAKGNEEIVSNETQNSLLHENVILLDKAKTEKKHNVSIVETDCPKIPLSKELDKDTVQKRTRRVSFGSISEYEYQRDGKLTVDIHEVPGRHSWSEHSTAEGYGNIQDVIPEQDRSTAQSKSICMDTLAQSLAKINSGKMLTFSPSSCSESNNQIINQSEAKIKRIGVDPDSSEEESLQKTPTLFFTHYEEEEDEYEVNFKIGLIEENRTSSNRYDTTVVEDCDRDFVYDSVPKNPADILRLYGFRRSSIDRPRLKGILKPSGSSHSLAEDSSLGDDTSISDNSLAKSPASPSSGRFKISPTKMTEHVVNTLLSSSPINSTASLRSSTSGSRFSVSPTKISDPVIFEPPEKRYEQSHHLSVNSTPSPSRFSVKRIDENTFVAPKEIETTDVLCKEKENVPVNAIVQEKTTPNQMCTNSETNDLTSLKYVDNLTEDGNACKNVHPIVQEPPSAKKESRFKASRIAQRAKDDKT